MVRLNGDVIIDRSLNFVNPLKVKSLARDAVGIFLTLADTPVTGTKDFLRFIIGQGFIRTKIRIHIVIL